MRVMAGPLLAIVVVAYAGTAGSAAGGAADPAQDKQAPAPAKKNPLLKLTQPWPSAEEMRERQAEAEALPLFATPDPITFTLAGDFKAINKDHDANSTKRFAAELRFAREDGRIDVLPVKLSARGHVRRMARTCDYVPLRVEFAADGLKETPFKGQKALKLVVQCRGGGEFEQYILREYLAYRLFNVLTPRSYRARLAKVTYVDLTSGQTVASRAALFLEDDSDVARRMSGRTVELQRILFKDVDRDTLWTMMVFQYMIANTDFSLYARHNVTQVQMPDRTLLTVPYDFDMSGLVHPPYAIPMRELPIKSVDERLYRGPCREPMELVTPILANFQAKQSVLLGLADSIAQMDKSTRQTVKSFLDGFYGSIKSDRDVKRLFVDCKAAPTM
jgi:hypothetical protein